MPIYSHKIKKWSVILLNYALVLRKNNETCVCKIHKEINQTNKQNYISLGILKSIIDEAKSPAPSESIKFLNWYSLQLDLLLKIKLDLWINSPWMAPVTP